MNMARCRFCDDLSEGTSGSRAEPLSRDGQQADRPYAVARGRALLTVAGGKHGLGGIAGYDAKETGDEYPDRLEITRRMIWAYLRSALIEDGQAGALGRVERKKRTAPCGRCLLN